MDPNHLIQSKLSQNGKSILLVSSIFLFFLSPLLLFSFTSDISEQIQPDEQVGLIKEAKDLLALNIWIPLLIVSVGILVLSFLLTRRIRNRSTADPSQSSPKSTLNNLGILGVITFFTYILFFLLPFPLHKYYDLRRVSMGWIADRYWAAALTLAFAIVALFLLYVSAYRILRQQSSRRLWGLVLFGALTFGMINFLVFPISSTDIYDYVSRGRISGFHGGNPLVEVPEDYPEDPYVQLAAWRKDPSAYGPFWEVLSGLIGRFSGGPLWNDMLGYKSIALISYTVSVLFIASILRRVAPHQSLSGTLFFAWNPLVILEGIANAHNDMLMIALLLGCFWFLTRNPIEPLRNTSTQQNELRNTLALVLLTLAVLVKFIPLLLLPPLLLYLSVKQGNGNSRYRKWFLYLIPAAIIGVLYYWVFWEWPEITSNILQRTGMFRMSLASATKLFLAKFLEEGWAMGIASALFLGIFGIGYFILIVQMAAKLRIFARWQVSLERIVPVGIGRIKAWIDQLQRETTETRYWDVLISTCLNIFLLYLLLGSLWFWPWYLIWPLALLALVQDRRMVKVLMVVSCAGQLSYMLWNFVWYWMGIEWETLYVIEMLVLALLLLPAIGIILISRRHRQVETSRDT
jgi:hypothetical protein